MGLRVGTPIIRPHATCEGGYVRGAASINGIEDFRAYTKERRPCPRGVSAEHFLLYLKEVEYWFSTTLLSLDNAGDQGARFYEASMCQAGVLYRMLQSLLWCSARLWAEVRMGSIGVCFWMLACRDGIHSGDGPRSRQQKTRRAGMGERVC